LTSLALPVAVALLAAALAAATYFLPGRPAPGLGPAVLGRAAAWAALALLLLNAAAPSRPADRVPLVLLDTSPSLEAAGGRAREARALADSLGEVRPFAGSLLRPALTAAAASGRPVVVVTDGEVRDQADLPPDLLAAAAIRVLPREPRPDRALVRVEGPHRIAAGDSLTLRAELRAFGDAVPSGPVAVEARIGGRVLASASVRPGAGGAATVVLEAGRVSLPPGEHLVEVAITTPADGEPRTDRRLHLLAVAATPGVVLVADPGGWESRFLYRALVEVAELPVEGFLRLEPGRWRRMRDLSPVGEPVLREAVRQADLLVTVGSAPAFAAGSRARGRWEWPLEVPLEGDWYLTPAAMSPLASALAGIPPDSLPPATALAPLVPDDGSWVALTAQAGRRGAERAAVVGRIEGSRRRMLVGAAGLWRWALRGGTAAEAYRAWVAASASWLLATEDSATGPIRVVRPVVERDAPVVFGRNDAGTGARVPVVLEGASGPRSDTLVFGAEGRAELRLPPGIWRYTTEGGGAGTIAVEEYSGEFLPAAVTLATREAGVRPVGRGRGTRELPWLFGLAILGWCVEWAARRRAGLR